MWAFASAVCIIDGAACLSGKLFPIRNKGNGRKPKSSDQFLPSNLKRTASQVNLLDLNPSN